MIRAMQLLPALALLFTGVGAARADILYANETPAPQNGGTEITGPYSTSNTFYIPNTANLTGAQIGLEVYAGSKPISVQWSIGTSSFGSDVGSGTATLTNSFYGNVNPLFDAYQSTFPLSGKLGAGVYWLTLSSATSTNSVDPSWTVYWDVTNGGLSLARAQNAGFGFVDGIPSEAFQIYGTTDPVSTPEPASITLLGIGSIVSVAGYGWRRRKQVAV